MPSRIAIAAVLLCAAPASAFVLETSARVEIVESVEIALPDTPRDRDAAGGLRLSCPDGVRAQVELVADHGLGRFRHVSYLERGDGWVRWDEEPVSCRVTVTIE